MTLQELYLIAKTDKYILDNTKLPVGAVVTRADGANWKKISNNKWQKVSESKYKKAAEEEFKNNPRNKHGLPFIKNSSGNIDFGYIDKEKAKQMKQPEGPIRLVAGHSGYGLNHIEEHHKKEILQKGYKNCLDFVEDVINNYDEIKEIKPNQRTYNGKPVRVRVFTLFMKKDCGYVLMEYEKSKYGKGFYNVNTAGIFTNGKITKGKLMWP